MSKRRSAHRECSIEALESRVLLTPVPDMVGFNPDTGEFTFGISDRNHFFDRPGPSLSTDVTWDMHAVDVSGDGLLDIIGRQEETGQWWAAISTGANLEIVHFGNWASDEVAGWQHVIVGDLNDDGYGDVVGMDQSGNLWASYSDGQKFHQEYLGHWNATGWSYLTLLDLNGDQNDDIVGFHGETNQWWAGFSDGKSVQTSFLSQYNKASEWTHFASGSLPGTREFGVMARTAQGEWYWGELNENRRFDISYIRKDSNSPVMGSEFVAVPVYSGHTYNRVIQGFRYYSETEVYFAGMEREHRKAGPIYQGTRDPDDVIAASRFFINSEGYWRAFSSTPTNPIIQFGRWDDVSPNQVFFYGQFSLYQES